MTPAKANLADHWRGDTWPGMVVTVTGIDLTGGTGKMQLRDRAGGTVIETWETGEENDVVIDGGAGTATVDAVVIDTDAGTLVYDLEFTLAGGEVRTVIQGTMKILEDITR